MILGFSCFAQLEEIKGHIENQSTQAQLHGAHIQNHTADKLVVSAPNGTFTIPVSIGDSISISYTGFKTFSFIVTEFNILQLHLISMEPDSVILDDVVVTPFPEYWRFKELILETQPINSSVLIKVPQVGKYAFYDPRTSSLNQDLGAPAIGIPFDLEKLSKKGREKKKLLEVLEKERKWRLAQAKFNRDWVASVTNLEGEVLTDFIAFCDFSADYIIETHLIDIKNRVIVLLDTFLSDLATIDADPEKRGA